MKAIMPLLDETSKKPYYLQIYDYIKDSILRGEITEGEKLAVSPRSGQIRRCQRHHR